MKNKSHKRVVYTRINPLSVGIALVIGLLWACTPAQYDDVYVAEPVIETPVVKVEAKELTKAEIESKIKHYFPRSYKTMIPIAYAESGLNPNSKNWNCYYTKKVTKKYYPDSETMSIKSYDDVELIAHSTRIKGAISMACKPSHRVYAYSVDCNVLQRNVKGQVCPNQTLDEHLKEVAELSKIQHFNAWSAYNNKSYLAYTK